MVTNDHFLAQLDKGHGGELAIEKVLQFYGWATFPTYHYKSEQQKAPKLKRIVTKDGKDIIEFYVSPDLDAAKNGKRIWVECKLEEGANWTYSLGRFDHGFGLKYYEHYRKVEEITGCPVWIFFLEYDQTSRIEKDIELCKHKNRPTPALVKYPKNILRGQLLSRLTPRHNFNRQMDKNYVYFNQKDFLYFGVVAKDTFCLLQWEVDGSNITSISVLEQEL